MTDKPTHSDIIEDCLRRCSPASARSIAAKTGLDYHAVARRLPEMQREGRVHASGETIVEGRRAAVWSISPDIIYRPPASPLEFTFDLVTHLRRQQEFSLRVFGPGDRTKGIIDHIQKELREIEANPTDLEEWIDVIILAFDGAWRLGALPTQIVEALVAKQAKNEARKWPDWRTAPLDKAVEHDRTGEQS